VERDGADLRKFSSQDILRNRSLTMGKKSNASKKKTGRNGSASKTSSVRNTPLPKSEPMKRVISHEMIAKRAYEIFASGQGGNQDENWHRAERELRS
jgi:hypothetical protein